MFSFVILHYMAIEETINCINDLQNKITGEKEIIVVDNASPNMSGEKLSKMYTNVSNVHVILSEVNLGFAKGNNLGYNYAVKYFDSDFIVVMNNDVEIVQTDFTDIVKEIYIEDSFSVLSPNIYAPKLGLNQSPKRLSSMTYEEVNRKLKNIKFALDRSFITSMRTQLKRIQWLRKLVVGSKNKKEKIDYESKHFNVPLHGSFFIFSRKFIDARKMCFNECTFMYYESEILDYECNRDGLKTMYSPRLKVIHYQNVATNQTFNNERKKVDFINKCSFESLGKFKELMIMDQKEKSKV